MIGVALEMGAMIEIEGEMIARIGGEITVQIEEGMRAQIVIHLMVEVVVRIDARVTTTGITARSDTGVAGQTVWIIYIKWVAGRVDLIAELCPLPREECFHNHHTFWNKSACSK